MSVLGKFIMIPYLHHKIHCNLRTVQVEQQQLHKMSNNNIKVSLVIVDTTVAPTLYIVGQQYSCSLSSSLKYTDS